MSRHDKFLNDIMLMEEEKAKELLAQILFSYAEIGTGGHNQEEFIRDVKNIYLRLALNRNDQ
jgi:hypothetical protein